MADEGGRDGAVGIGLQGEHALKAVGGRGELVLGEAHHAEMKPSRDVVRVGLDNAAIQVLGFRESLGLMTPPDVARLLLLLPVCLPLALFAMPETRPERGEDGGTTAAGA